MFGSARLVRDHWVTALLEMFSPLSLILSERSAALVAFHVHVMLRDGPLRGSIDKAFCRVEVIAQDVRMDDNLRPRDRCGEQCHYSSTADL